MNLPQRILRFRSSRIENNGAGIDEDGLRHSYRTVEIISSLSDEMTDYEESGDGLPVKKQRSAAS